MRAGKLDRVITVQTYTAGEPDDYGVSTPGWSELATVRAELIQASTKEYLTGAGEEGRSAVIFRTRHLQGVTTGDRVIYEGTPHDIKEIKEIGRRHGLELRTEASEQ